jgi:hypothetical protein
LAGDLGDRRVRVYKPTVAETGRAADRSIVIGGKPDRRVGMLDRPARHRDVGQFADVVFKADIVFGPQPLDDIQTLFETAHALAARHAEGVELDIAIAQPDTKDEIAAPDRVERGNAFGDLDRVVQRRQQHTGDTGHLPRLGGEPR